MIAIISLLLFAACDSGEIGEVIQSTIDNNTSILEPTKLETPSNVRLDDGRILRWDSVLNASGYTVTINSRDNSATVPSFDVSTVLTQNGSFEVYIRALTNHQRYYDSELSGPYTFEYNGIVINKLSAPQNVIVEYDYVTWEAVDNAEYYTVRVNDNYNKTVRGTSCSLLSFEELGNFRNNNNANDDYGIARIEVKANENGEYIASDWSETVNYEYVPVSRDGIIATLSNYSIGYGYNLINDDYLDISKSSNTSVFNVGKLFRISDFVSANNPSAKGESIYYSSTDQFISNTQASFEYKSEKGCVLLGSLKTQISVDASFDYTKYDYHNTFTTKYDITYKDYSLKNLDEDYLRASLSNSFIQDVKRESSATRGMNDDQLVEYLFSKYGTHAILGITTGGTFFAEYNIDTNRKDIAGEVKVAFSASVGGDSPTQIVQKNWGISGSLQEKIENNHEEINSRFKTYYYGGSGGATTSTDGLNSALSAWSASMSEDTAKSIKFTKDGAIPISYLVSTIDLELSAKLENYINERADSAYNEIAVLYSRKTNLPMDVEVVDGKNVLVIDLSDYQQIGTLENAYNNNFLDGVLSVYPNMLLRDIDKVKIIGEFTDYLTCNIINGFSIKLSDTWKRVVDLGRAIEIEFENVGVACTLEGDLVDRSDLPNSIEVNTTYIGTNYVENTEKAGVLYIDGEKTYTVYRYIQYTPQINSRSNPLSKVIVDWRNSENGVVDYAAAVNSSGTRYGGGNNNLDIGCEVEEVYFYGNAETVYKNLNIIPCSFNAGDELTLHFIDFNYYTTTWNALRPWYNDDVIDDGMILTVDISGDCSIRTESCGYTAVYGFENIIITGDGNLTIRGSDGISGDNDGKYGTDNIGNLTMNMSGGFTVYGGNGRTRSSEGTDGGAGGIGIKANNMTILSVGMLTVYGGNGGNGTVGSTGSQGYLGFANYNGWQTPSCTAGVGGNGGNGGNGGDAISVHGKLSILSVAQKNIYLFGGNGGNGGKGGKGGHGGENNGTWYIATPAGLDGARGGNGGNGGDGGIGGCDTVVNLGGKGGAGGEGGEGGSSGASFSWGAIGTLTATGTNGGTGARGATGNYGITHLIVFGEDEMLIKGNALKSIDEFVKGQRYYNVYDNSLSGDNPVYVEIENQLSSIDNLSGLPYEMKITSKIGADKEHMGGYYKTILSSANKVFYFIIYAKIPVGYSIGMYHNKIGNGRYTEWLTDNAGTNEFKWYLGKTVCGTSGTFETLGFIAIYPNEDNTNPEQSVVWYVGYSNIVENGVVSEKKAEFIYGDSRYAVYSGNMNWNAAEAYAESLGGHLVTIGSAQEEQAIINKARAAGLTRFWIGFSDAETEGVFRWVNGEETTYTNWESGQPDNYENAEDYTEIVLISETPYWNDNGAGSSAIDGFVIEFHITVTPGG